jgi:two-component system cell cycle sensor histidine kinase/response regulator CckA
MAAQDVSQDRRPAAVDRSGDRGGSIGMVLAVALLLVGSVIAFLFIGRANAQPYILALLSVLAVIGVFSLFAGAAGILRLAGRDTQDTFVNAIPSSAPDGILVTDPAGRVVYANAAYLTLVDAVDADDVRPVERVFVGDPLVSEAVYRLAKASRESRALQEEVRVPGADGTLARWLRFRVRPLQESGAYARWTAWTVSDVTRDRDRQENVFQELQHAIDYLDHAPAGFFSVDQQGNVSYLNATLAGWLDYDLAQVGSGGLKIADIVAGDGAALLQPVAGEPGDVKTEVHDLDLKTRGGRTVPVRLYHKVAFAADGTPGASRTLVLNRAREEVADPLRAAEVRFVRFFTTRRWRSRPSTRQARSRAPTPRSFGCSTASSRARRCRRRAARSSPWWRITTAPRSKPRSAGRRTGRAISRRWTWRSPARAIARRGSMCLPWRTRKPKARPRSSIRSRRLKFAISKSRSRRYRRWTPSASLPAASRTTSTTCSLPS